MASFTSWLSRSVRPLTNTLSYPYAQAEALTVQEREPTSKPRAEIAEVWGGFAAKPYFDMEIAYYGETR
jgi:hypothetical protein